MTPRAAWAVLVVAGLLEVGWPTLGTAAALVLSMALLALALRALPLGTAYAVWTGIGTVGTALLGIALFREPATAGRLACIALIVVGIVGLRLLVRPA